LRDVLRKVLIFVGLMILLAGLVLLAFGSVRSTELEQLNSSINSWKVSGNLTRGNTYVFDIYGSDKWKDDWSAGGYTTPQPVGVVITSPDGGNTSLTAYFYATAPVSGVNYTVPGSVPTFVQVTYQSVDSNSLSVDTSYLQARFTVKNGGNYTARIIPESINWTSGPPYEMLFEEEVTENPGSFENLLEGSGLVCLFTGAAVSLLAIRARKGTRIKRKSARAKS
jgi:hypothetical protein